MGIADLDGLGRLDPREREYVQSLDGEERDVVLSTLLRYRRRDEAPIRERLLRGRDRAIDVLRTGLREDADGLAVGRARGLEGLAG